MDDDDAEATRKEEDDDDDDEEQQQQRQQIHPKLNKKKAGENGDDNDEHSDGDDSDDDDDDLADIPDTREYTPIDVEGLQAMGFSHVGSNSATYMGDDGADNADDGSDADDVNISADDALLVAAKTEEDFASLEVFVYEQKTGNLFVHHDIPLPAFPLCLAHGDVSPSGTAGNFCAVGTFNPGIEVWNLDVLNALEPSCVLGGEDTTMADDLMRYNMMNGPQKGMQHDYSSSHGKNGLKPGSHVDAIMALSWNTVHRQVIASGSADCTVKLWDITKESNAGTFHHHKDKVQAVAWHPQEGTLLATGSYDRTVALLDARGSADSIKKVKIPADCEAIAWDPHNNQYLTAASEDGTVKCWDVRKFSTSTPVWSFVANEYGGVSDISYNPSVPGMMVTCSTDKTIQIYDVKNVAEASKTPVACGSKDMNVGKLYTVSFYPSSPFLLACAGSGHDLALWDMTHESAIQNKFGSRVVVGAAQSQQKHKQRGGDNTMEGDDDENANASNADFEAMMSNSGNDNSNSNKVPDLKKNKGGGSSSKKKRGGGNKKKKAHKVR
mmetsp:Transcript_2666/g.7334  ORF Transcript_2666/g.7334 Transcript_2666/m.7334 type:complete len:553 (+) Transcript_2666:142-1800(+)